MLSVTKLNFSYHGKVIFDELSFELEKSEIGTIIGLSGAGKTTMFNLLTGLLPCDTDSILIDGVVYPYSKNKIAYMTQEDLLLPWRTVLDNILITKELGHHSKLTDNDSIEVNELLDELNLQECKHLYPHQLSGGMKKRVSLARALFQKKPLLLLDEPFNSLDILLREQMYTLLKSIQTKYDTTILMVSHDFRDALTFSDKIFALQKGKIAKEWRLSGDLKENALLMTSLEKDLRDCLKASLA